MERLTIPDVILDRGVIQRSIIDAEKVKECAMELYWRLKAVEDAIADEESEEYDLNRLRELVEADRDGRCMVLPCKVGSPVWRVYDDCEFPGDCGTKQKCNGCEYRNIFAEEQAFCLSMLSQNGKLGHPYYTNIEAAEAALKGDQHGKDL